MADYGIEKAYFSITFVTCTMRRESKIVKVETVDLLIRVITSNEKIALINKIIKVK